MSRFLSGVPLILFVAGCASRAAAPAASGAGPTATAATRSAGRSQTVISEDEIAENVGILNVYDLISRIRPSFLRSAVNISDSKGPDVRVDNGPQREVGDLRTIDLRQVKEIRYYAPSEANVRYGIDTNVPVIAVTLKRLK